MESPEVIQSLMRLDVRKLQNVTLEVKVFVGDDGWVYAYYENGWIQGPRERMGMLPPC